jgi:PTS hybrid protein
MNPDATVGIVLVSHSAALAEGAADLASQVAGGPEGVAVIPAGGTDDGGLGTSEAKVQAAIKRADRGAGVRALLADADELPGRVELADAPFVEGVVAATVTAAAGVDIEAVRAAAEEAWNARKL